MLGPLGQSHDPGVLVEQLSPGLLGVVWLRPDQLSFGHRARPPKEEQTQLRGIVAR
jgi:hypothetical protein